MDLRLLRYFLKIAQVQNITMAAKLLHVTQPTLSKELRQLEDDLGTQLFIRTNKAVILTEDGMYLRKKAKEIVTLADELEAEFKRGRESFHGDIYIGSGEALSVKTIANCILRINQQYEQICFHIYSGDGDALLERLNRGLVDFAVLMGTPELSLFECLKFPSQEQWGFYVHEDFPLADKGFISPEDILDIPLILPERPGLRRIIADWSGQESDQLNIVARYNLMYNVSFLVKNRTACALGLNGLINNIENSALVFLPLKPAMTEQYYIVWKKNQPMKNISRLFINELETIISEQNESNS